MTDDALYQDEVAHDEYEDEDASHNHASQKSPDGYELRPEHRSPSFVDDGFFSQRPFGDNFPSDFDEFLREPSSFGEKEQKAHKPTKAPSKPQEPRRPFTQPPVKKPFEDEDPFEAPIGRPTFGQSASDQRKPARKPVKVERPIKDHPFQGFNTESEQDSHRQTAQEESAGNEEDAADQHNHQQEKESAPIKPSAPLPRPPPQRPTFNPQFRQPQVKRPQGSFNPSNIVYESGFKPIRTVNGPVPSLGFEVESQLSNDEESKDADEKSSTAQETADRNPVSLEPIFIASEPDRNNIRSQDPVPIPLPEAVVPVVPGRAPPVPKLPTIVKPLEIPAQQRQPQLQTQRPRIPPVQPVQPPQGPQQTLSPFIRPPANTNFRQSPLPPFVNQPPQQSPAFQPPQQNHPQRKKTSGLASLFNLGGQRRQQNEPQFPPPPPPAPLPPR